MEPSDADGSISDLQLLFEGRAVLLALFDKYLEGPARAVARHYLEKATRMLEVRLRPAADWTLGDDRTRDASASPDRSHRIRDESASAE